MITQTSLESYLDLVLHPQRLNANQTLVLDVFRKMVERQPLSNFDVATILDWPINRITPRIKELREAGRLVQVGWKRQLETGRRVMLWGLPEDNMDWIDFDYKEE